MKRTKITPNKQKQKDKTKRREAIKTKEQNYDCNNG